MAKRIASHRAFEYFPKTAVASGLALFFRKGAGRSAPAGIGLAAAMLAAAFLSPGPAMAGCLTGVRPIQKWEYGNANLIGYGEDPLGACRLGWGLPAPCPNAPEEFCNGTDYILPDKQFGTSIAWCVNWSIHNNSSYTSGEHFVASSPAYLVNLCPAGYQLSTESSSLEYLNIQRGVVAVCVPKNSPPACDETPGAPGSPSNPSPGKNGGPPPRCLAAGNPINSGTGNKYQLETDYVGSGPFPLRFARAYNSAVESGSAYGYHWSVFGKLQASSEFISALRPDGKILYFLFLRPNNVWVSDPDVHEKMADWRDIYGVRLGWELTDTSGIVDRYDTGGRLVTRFHPSGLVQRLKYETNRITVTDSFGRAMVVDFGADGRISTLTVPDGGVYHYSIDALGRLTAVTNPDGTSRSYLYENAGFPNALTGIVDESGARYATWSYDSQGRAVSSQHAGGVEQWQVGYGADIATVTDPLGTIRARGITTILGVVHPTGESQPGGSGCGSAASEITYDTQGNVASRTDFNGNRTLYTYDLARNLETRRVEAAGTPEARTVSTEWHGYWPMPVHIAEPNRITTFVYNGGSYQGSTVSCAPASAQTARMPAPVLCLKLEQATTDANGGQGFSAMATGVARTWRYTYDSLGQVLTADGPRTDVSDLTTYSYYPLDDADLARRGQLATVANALGQQTMIQSYDMDGHPLSITDANGTLTTLQYDLRGRILSRTQGGEETRFVYDPVGNLTQVIPPTGATLTYVYDAAHRLQEIHDGEGNRIVYTLDNASRRTKETVYDAGGSLVETRSQVYDALGRLAQSIGAQGQTTTYSWDAEGNRTGVADPLGHSTTYSYDALNRLAQSVDPLGGQTRYSYDGQSNLTEVVDPRSLATAYQYDGLGQRLRTVSPDSGTSLDGYDEAGNVLTHTDAKGQTTRYRYDALNRPTRIDRADGSAVVYLYDQGGNAIGRQTGFDELATDGSTRLAVRYAYDLLGRIVRVDSTRAGRTQTVAYAYANGLLSGITYPSGRQILYSRDGQGLISALSALDPDGSSHALVQNVRYLPFGGVQSFRYGNGQTFERAFDQDGRIQAFRLPDGIPVLTYDAAGNITAIADPQANWQASFQYDALDRLTAATVPTGSYSYSYDADGNRLSAGVNGQATAYRYGSDSNRLLGVGGRDYAYDANGSTTADGNNQYVYDAAGRMKTAATPAGTWNYQVDSQGRRIAKDGPSGSQGYVYGLGGQILAETDADGQTAREYYWLGDLPVGAWVR